MTPLHILPKYFGAFYPLGIMDPHSTNAFEKLKYSEMRFYKRTKGSPEADDNGRKITACRPFQGKRKFHEYVAQYRICINNTYQNTHTYYNIYLLGYMGEGNERYNLYAFPRNFTEKYLRVKANDLDGKVTDINTDILQSKMLQFPFANGITVDNTPENIPNTIMILSSKMDQPHWNVVQPVQPIKVVTKSVRLVPPQYVVNLMVSDAIVKGETCPILYDPLTKENTVVTSCFHLFSREAFADWRKKSKECPKCREECVVTV
jgi:hypothetical protein